MTKENLNKLVLASRITENELELKTINYFYILVFFKQLMKFLK